MTSLATMLFDSPAAGRAQLDTLLGPSGLDIGRLTVAGHAIQPPQVSGALFDLLDMPIGNIAVQGWSTAMEVERARQRTLAAPGSREIVTLGKHSITSTQSPTVEASLGGATIPVLRLTIEVRIQVSGVRLLIEADRLVDTTAGQAGASATVSADGITLFHRSTRPVDLNVRTPSPQSGPVRTVA
jgi:hypothetical protein